MLNIEKNRLTNSFFIAVIILLFFITVLIKLNFFFNYFINIDSAFYVKWFTDLSLTNKIFSNNENTFYKSLLLHKDTLAHNYLDGITITLVKFIQFYLLQLTIY